MLPFFDADTNMLYLAGKGDTNIRYFEIDDEPPYQYFVNQFIGKEPQRGCAFVPKKGLDTGNCEIMRFLRLTQNAVEPVTFSVPRKGEQFRSDLYPDTCAGRASLKSAEWFEGRCFLFFFLVYPDICAGCASLKSAERFQGLSMYIHVYTCVHVYTYTCMMSLIYIHIHV